MKIAVPANATVGYGDLPAGWTCDTDAGKCKYGDIPANAAAPTLDLSVTLPAGENDQKATITATADTQSHEASTANNTAYRWPRPCRPRLSTPRSPGGPALW